MDDGMGGDPIMDAQPPMADPMADPNSMGGDAPQDDTMGDDQGMNGDPSQGLDDQGSSDEENEINDLMRNMSIEDKAAVVKYARSIADDSGSNGDSEVSSAMPTQESRRSWKKMIDEIFAANDDNDSGAKRDEKKIPSKYRDKKSNPFVSPF